MNRLISYLKPAARESTAIEIAAALVHQIELGKPAQGTTEGSKSAITQDLTRLSAFPVGDFRNASARDVNDIKCEVMVNWLHSQQEEKQWLSGDDEEGVVLKKSKSQYTCAPARLSLESAILLDVVKQLNVRVALTITTRVIRIMLQSNKLPFIEIHAGLRLQVLKDIADLPQCQKHQFAAFIEAQGYLVVWDDDPRRILERAEGLETAIMSMVWNTDMSFPDEPSEKQDSDKDSLASRAELEDGLTEKPRRLVLMQAWLTGITLIICISGIGAGWREIAIEMYIDHDLKRLLFLLAIVPQFWLSLFFFQALVGNVAQICGPVRQVFENTKYYSGVAPRRLSREGRNMPHVTIQCPVYKESLQTVIEPTIRSIKAAISTYEMQGGTANIFINDDGMQLISSEDASARRELYEEHNIGWVARPKHNPHPPDGMRPFHRRGKFKKASNMNYALWVSQRIEQRLGAIHRGQQWSQSQESKAYSIALAQTLAEDEGRSWAEGNVRIGDYILLIDSDTRVPQDCLLEAVSEMEQSPQVAIIQFASGVMNVTDSFFERGITFFTNLVYTQIRYAVANGDVAPFVGHNAILRWAAMQEIAYDCPDDLREKYWSEATVSEDFDMALRLQTHGYLVRLAAYQNDGFKEGVSLTVYDELARWEKYAYGCNELIFYPILQWPARGILTPLFRQFIASSMPLPSKFTICAYIGTYYALGSAFPLTVMNYFVSGWFNGHIDHYYLDSFRVYFSIIIVFTALGNIALAVLRYRVEEKTLGRAFWENFKWIPLMSIFLGGVSLHVSQALLSHMFGVDMTWGATSKEKQDVTFFEEIPRVIRRFSGTFVLSVLLATVMVVCATVVPVLWQIKLFIAVFPLSMTLICHFLLPIVLNPDLMLFTW